ncbi:MAG: adenylate/guanylate cyclase domain-containing protein [Bradyrhizobium sp.]
MTDKRVERRLAAVLAADVAGYSRLMGADEEGTLGKLKAFRKALVDPKIVEHRGRIVKTTGDGMLVEFASAVDAARCAVEIQRDMAAHNADVPQDTRIEFRIGIHVGDIIIDDNDIFGDGVNIAARLEGIAEPGGVCISDDAHRQIRGKVDFSYNDMGPQSLKNIIEPMRAWRMQLGNDAISLLPLASPAVPVQALALPDKPSIAVLAFQNMSGDAEQEYFADGIAEDIITALSKSRWLFVIARNSSFTYKGHAVDIKQIGRELGVRYVLEGSVRKAGNRLRITGQLIEAATGTHLWAERYDRALEDIFTVQDEITHSIIGAIAPGILAAEIQRSQGKETAELGQWERLMRAHWHIRRFTREDSSEAIRLLDELLMRQPDNAMALADLAFSLHFAALFGWTNAPAAAKARMSETARRAVASDEQDAAAHTSLGIHELFLGQHDNAIRRLLRAIDLDPNSSFARGYLGTAYAFGGECDPAIENLQEAMRLSPRDFLMVVWFTVSAWAYLSAGKFEQASDCAKRAIDCNPAFPDAHGTFAAASAHLGHMDDARAGLDDFVRLMPGLTVGDERLIRPFRRPTDRERFLDGLRKAGLPEQ